MVDWIKEHPYLTGGLALAIIILIVVIKNASSSSQASSATTASTSSGTDDTQAVAALQANSAIEQMAYSAQTQVAGQNAAVNVAAINAAAAESIANNQSNNSVAIASIGAGGIAPFSVAGTPGYNAAQTVGAANAAAVVGNAQVQAQLAQQGVEEATMINSVSNGIKTAANSGASVVNPGVVSPIPTSVGPNVNPAAGAPDYNSVLVGLQTGAGYGGGVCNDPATCPSVPGFESEAETAAADWSAYYGPSGTIVQNQAAANAALNKTASASPAASSQRVQATHNTSMVGDHEIHTGVIG
jgi:hypothetical protein